MYPRCDAGWYCGFCLDKVKPEDCPPPSNMSALTNCGLATPGDLCIGDGTCGTYTALDNCDGGVDLYRKASFPPLAQKRVISLRLISNNLVGTLPTELGLLEHLRSFELQEALTPPEPHPNPTLTLI